MTFFMQKQRRFHLRSVYFLLRVSKTCSEIERYLTCSFSLIDERDVIEEFWERGPMGRGFRGRSRLPYKSPHAAARVEIHRAPEEARSWRSSSEPPEIFALTSSGRNACVRIGWWTRRWDHPLIHRRFRLVNSCIAFEQLMTLNVIFRPCDGVFDSRCASILIVEHSARWWVRVIAFISLSSARSIWVTSSFVCRIKGHVPSWIAFAHSHFHSRSFRAFPSAERHDLFHQWFLGIFIGTSPNVLLLLLTAAHQPLFVPPLLNEDH